MNSVINLKITKIYDNNGKTIDRFTMFINDNSIIGMSENPASPQGFCMYVNAVEGEHLGKIITVNELPEEVKIKLKSMGLI